MPSRPWRPIKMCSPLLTCQASGDIMMALRQPERMGEVRGVVQGHVRELRKKGFKESVHLHSFSEGIRLPSKTLEQQTVGFCYKNVLESELVL